jgi:putative membrane protein
MHVGRHYPLKDVFFWTVRETTLFLALGLTPPVLATLGVPLPHLPWPPVALVGTAVAFVTGFKGNAAYNRLWEARQIWGGIVNASRAWSNLVHGFLVEGSDDDKRTLILRHIAWLTALRFQLREPRGWEGMEMPHNRAYQERTFHVPERTEKVMDRLAGLLPPDEAETLSPLKNRAAHPLALQGATLARLAREGLSEQRHIEMERCLATLYDLQGRCERIKNFPYPRQYATMNLIFVWMLIGLLPFAVYSQLSELGSPLFWLTTPTTVVIAWLFHTMDKVSESSENPFEGSANDTPITTMSRAIEIDLREMARTRGLAGLEPVPPPHPLEHLIQV